VADNAQPLDHTPGPLGDRGEVTLAAAVRALEKLVDLTTLEVDLMRANNALLTLGRGGSGRVHGGGGKGASSSGDLDAVFAKYFGKESTYVDPQKGLGRWAGKKLGRAWRGSKTRSFGKTGGKFAIGAARSLGGGKKTRKVFGAIGTAAGKVVGVVTTVVETFVKARNAVDGWTEAAFQSAARLAEVSGSMAAVMAQRQVAQLQRDIERGEATAGSANRLQQAEARRKEEENKLGATIDNATNNILAVLNDLLTPIIAGVNLGVEGLKAMPFGVGAAIRALLAGDPVEDGSLVEIGRAARAEMAAADARGGALMAAARAAAISAIAGRAPEGARPPGGLP